MLILLSISVFLISRAEFRRAIFARADLAGHPGVAPLLVEDDPLDELGVGDRAAVPLLDLDLVHVADGLAAALLRRSSGPRLRRSAASSSRDPRTPFEPIAVVAQSRRIASSSGLTVVPISVSRRRLGLLDGQLESAGDDGRVDVLLEQGLGALEKLAGEDHRGGRPVAALLVLGLSDLDQHLGRRMLDVDFLEDGHAVVRDRDVAHRIDEHLVHAPGTEGRPDRVRNGSRRGDVVPRGALASLALRAFLQDENRRSPEASDSPTLDKLRFYIKIS